MEVDTAIAPAPVDPEPITVHVTNPTPYHRKQGVIFGTDYQTPLTYKTLPGSYLNVGQVTVPPGFTGDVEVTDNPDKKFIVHPSINKALPTLKFYVTINGQRLEMVSTKPHTLHNGLFSFEYAARHQRGIAKLWTYCFHNQPTVTFELGFYYENLNQAGGNVTLSFEAESAIPCFYKVHYGNVASLINRYLDDCQGKVWKGVLDFYSPNDVTPDEINTFFGEWNYPLFAMARWNTWGPWKKAPPTYDAAIMNSAINSRKNLNYADFLGHFGEIGNKTPGDTGNQAGWGCWQQYLGVGAKRSELCFFDYLAAMQDNVRPIHYFEVNGSRFNAQAHIQSRCVFWSQRLHWHHVVCPDRLGRTHNEQWINGWGGYDDQHAGATVISNQVILHGSLAAAEYCASFTEAAIARQTLPSQFPGWSTNGADFGRSARALMASVMTYYATGDEQGVRHLAARFNECFVPQWVGTNTAPLKPGSIKGPSSAAGALLNYDSWTVWEDGLWVMCCDTLWPVLQQIGLTAEATIVRNMVWEIGRTVTMYGWHPNEVLCGVAIKWNGDGSPCENYLDPTKAKFYNAYNTWMLPCLDISKREALARGATEVAQRAETLATAIRSQPQNNYTLQFDGAR